MSVIAGIVISIMFFASIAYIETQARVMNRASNKSDRRIVMDGLYAYTVNGIKQSWCFKGDWVEDINCNLNNARYTQRLLLSDESLLFIRNSGASAPSPITAARLSEINSDEISLAPLTSSHPLYSIVAPVKEDYRTVRFKIERDSTAISAVRGREIPLKISVFLKHKTDSSLDETLVSRNIVYPRELSYFSLVLANDLYLNNGKNDATKGNVRLDSYSVSANTGLRFESPVFVNGSVHLPPTAPQMNNVVFVDKIVLGAGEIKLGDQPYMVKTAGGEGYMYNYNMPTFGGLMGGFELDPERDLGLDYLFKLRGDGETNYDKATRCRERLMASYQLDLTGDAQMWLRVNSGSANQASIQLNMGNTDNFIEQDINLNKSTTTVPNVDKSAVLSNVSGNAVIKAKVYYNGLLVNGNRGAYSTDFYIPRQGTVTLYPNGSAGSSITINASPLVVDSRTQFNQVNLNFTINGVNLDSYTADNTGTATAIKSSPSLKFVFEGYDYGYSYGKNLRSSGILPVKTNGITFTKNSAGSLELSSSEGNTVTSTGWLTNSGLTTANEASYPRCLATPADTANCNLYKKRHEPSDGNQNWAEFDDQCFATPDPTNANADFSAFPAATWDTSFATQARHAWAFDTAFANQTPEPGYYDGTINYNAAAEKVFHIDSIVKNCVVGPNQTLLAGFFVCENFIIQPRAQALRIIGTVIANQVQIDGSAYRYGIRWSTIYHPQAAQELIKANILGRDKANQQIDCNAIATPLWQSNIGLTDRYNHWICNAVSLRQADPFKWSTVDPDCGIVKVKESTSVKCKKKATRFLIKEVSRGKGL